MSALRAKAVPLLPLESTVTTGCSMSPITPARSTPAMTENTHSDIPRRGTGGDTGVTLLAAGGLAAAFGVASCCALPMLLGSLGVGSAWLIAVAWVAAPHRLALLIL